jgi:hypothetical protein
VAVIEAEPAPAARAVAADGDATRISEQLPRRRRRLGLSLVGLGVVALAAQSWVEWLLPYDLAALETMRRLSRSPTLGAAQLVWAWAVLCAALLVALARARSASLVQTQGGALLCGWAWPAWGGTRGEKAA